MAVLPWEMITDILSRLPVEDLLRYRSVAKPWRSLIDRPDFIKLHLAHSLETTTTTNLTVLLNSPQGLQSFSLDSPSPAAHPLGLSAAAGEVEILGTRDGLVALAYSSGDMALWNPATRAYRNLPASGVRSGVVYTFGATGFGYGPVRDDHRLLRVAHYCETASLSASGVAEVYSLKAESWSAVGGFPTYYDYHRNAGVSVGGSLNWMATTKSEDAAFFRIVAFDLSTEESRELSVPDLKGNGYYLKLAELNGSLCLERNLNPDQYSDRVEVWVMKEYGVKESWTKLFSVVPSSSIGNFAYAIPIVHLKGSDRVLVDIAGERFVLYDMKKKRAENLGVDGLPKSFSAHFCMKSLVGVGGGNLGGAEEDGNKRKKHKSGKKRDDFLSKGFKLVL